VEGLFVLAQEDSGLSEVTRHSASCFPRALNPAQSAPCLPLLLLKLICCSMESNFIAARSTSCM
jgi:hypothetical protein